MYGALFPGPIYTKSIPYHNPIMRVTVLYFIDFEIYLIQLAIAV